LTYFNASALADERFDYGEDHVHQAEAFFLDEDFDSAHIIL
jgi:hypothetical protein